MDCVFCRITEKKIPARIIFENERVIIFKDHRPQVRLHLLVCPKRHFPTFCDTPIDEVAYLFKVCRQLAEYLKVQNGFRLMINNGPQSGQIVFHLHVHFLCWTRDIGDEKIDLAIDEIEDSG